MGGSYKGGHRQLSVVSVNQPTAGWNYLQFSVRNVIFPVAGPQPLSDHRGKVERGLTGEVIITEEEGKGLGGRG